MECEICSQVYSQERVPKVLSCGHTYCAGCLGSIKSSQRPYCPNQCEGVDLRKTNVASLPTVFALMVEVEKACSTHPSQSLDLLCRQCHVAVCVKCLGGHPGHPVRSYQEYESEASKDFEESLNKITEMKDRAEGTLEKNIKEKKSAIEDASEQLEEYSEDCKALAERLLLISKKAQHEQMRMRHDFRDQTDELMNQFEQSLGFLEAFETQIRNASETLKKRRVSKAILKFQKEINKTISQLPDPNKNFEEFIKAPFQSKLGTAQDLKAVQEITKLLKSMEEGVEPKKKVQKKLGRQIGKKRNGPEPSKAIKVEQEYL